MPAGKGYKSLSKFFKRSAVGAGIGYVSSRATSSSAEASVNAKAGAIVGALTAGFSPILGAKALKKVKTSKPVFKARATARKGSFVFRKIRGRIVPIRAK